MCLGPTLLLRLSHLWGGGGWPNPRTSGFQQEEAYFSPAYYEIAHSASSSLSRCWGHGASSAFVLLCSESQQGRRLLLGTSGSPPTLSHGCIKLQFANMMDIHCSVNNIPVIILGNYLGTFKKKKKKRQTNYLQ